MIIPAVLGVLVLGYAFDMTFIPFNQYPIYDQDDIKSKLQVETNEVLESKFRVINNSSDLFDFFDLDPELTLRQKFHRVGIGYYGGILQADVDRSKTVEIILYVNYEVGSMTFPPDTKLRTDWQTRPQKYVGTHYIKSITTGGQFILSYKLYVAKPEYMDDVRAAVASYIGVSGVIDERLTKNLDKFQEAIKDKAFPGIETLSTGVYPTLIYDLRKGIEFALEVPKMVKNTDDGRGKPLKLELFDLHTIQPSYLEYKRNPNLIPVLREVFEMYDDLRVSMKEYTSWNEWHPFLRPEQRNQIKAYYGRLKEADRAMNSALSRLDSTGSTNQFEEAFKTYGEGRNYKYLTELHAIMKSIEI